MSKASRAAAARYGSVARAYRSFWAPAMIALSRPLIRAMPVEVEDCIADLGSGVGAVSAGLVPRARTVIGLDVSEEMVRHASREVVSVVGEMEKLPFASESLEGAFSTFALQHVSRTGDVFREVARALRPGGFFATATWGTDHAEVGGVYEVLTELFARHRIPAEDRDLKTWHSRVDEPSKVTRHANSAGLTVENAWVARSTYRWTARGFIGWATTMGPYGRRLASVPDQVRARVIDDLKNDIAPLPRDALRWTPECVYAISIKE
jgi:ubiquinone/menaquinone biosynthesis C-methylase UbiE